MEKKFRTQLLLMAGFTEEEIKEKNLLDMTAEEITRMAREKLFGMNRGDITALIEKDKQELNGSHKQKVVSIDVIEQYVNNGFVVKMALGNDRYKATEKRVRKAPRTTEIHYRNVKRFD